MKSENEKKLSKKVFVTFAFEATHDWETCPYPEVDFLKYPHRHLFHIRLEKKVNHNNRDVEFIILKRSVESFINSNWNKKYLPGTSCEDMAETLLLKFEASKVEVSEDGENGAMLEVFE